MFRIGRNLRSQRSVQEVVVLIWFYYFVLCYFSPVASHSQHCFGESPETVQLKREAIRTMAFKKALATGQLKSMACVWTGFQRSCSGPSLGSQWGWFGAAPRCSPGGRRWPGFSASVPPDEQTHCLQRAEAGESAASDHGSLSFGLVPRHPNL